MTVVRQADLWNVPLYFAYRRINRNDEHKETFHSHQGTEILYVHQGEGTMVVNHTRYELRPGMLCVFQPYQLHHLRLEYAGGSAFERSLAIFEPAMFDAYFAQWPALHAFYKHLCQDRLSAPCIYGLEEADELELAFRSMHERYPSLSKKDQFEEISLFLVALFRCLKPLWQKRTAQAPPLGARKTHQAEKILEWIESHYAEPFRLDAMAGELHLSPYHVSHLFKDATGVSITEYIAARRVHQAVLLLTTTKKPIALVAEEIGMANVSYFCKFFKARMGATPHQYRKRWIRHGGPQRE
ncbi:AraC family transcriptional regulator [Paenibacillus arenilitoris]|uniref:Helix-turn-helix transcriptional regulator n=1 Tax=Paenibacillus arenilitoris TaxID=2772299 RepID=A0A927CJK5_9BACL|nr:AraC family transcriptional regulator [Paenibacillus arenilitoris]MBD2868650.1 helix-turn-helix transcriptional regulator [Paenibacillus arenilitoris]